MGSKVKDALKIGLGVALATSLLTGCLGGGSNDDDAINNGLSGGSSNSGSSSGGSSNNGSSNNGSSTLSINRQPISINQANAGEVAVVAAEALTALDEALEITDLDGILPAFANPSQVTTAATNNYSCTNGGQVNFNETSNEDSDNYSVIAEYIYCQEDRTTINGTVITNNTYKETANYSNENNFFETKNFSIKNNLAYLSINGSMQESYSEDQTKKTSNYSLAINNLTIKSNGNYSDYKFNGNYRLNGNLVGSCKEAEGIETCIDKTSLVELESDGAWFVMSNAEVTTTQNYCSDIFDFNCNSDDYIQTGSYYFNSNKTESYGQLKVIMNQLKFREDWSTNDLDTPIAGSYTVQGSGKSKLVFEFTGRNQANLSITAANGVSICINQPVDFSDTANLKTLVAYCR